MRKLAEIYSYIDEIAPFALAQPWDNCGILVGDGQADINTVLVALDLTPEVLAEAKALGAELVIAHHPLIFHAVKRIDSASHLYQVLASGIHVLAAHTNLDASLKGVNACLADVLQLQNVRGLSDAPNALGFADYGDGILGQLPTAMTAQEFAEHVKHCLKCRAVAVANAGHTIQTVAVCGGSKGDLAVLAKGKADAILTGELKHSDYLDALNNNLTAVGAGHYHTEAVVIQPLAKLLQAKFPDLKILPTAAERAVPEYL